MLAETIRMYGHEGDLIDAYSARPTGSGSYPGVVVLHHMPGWDSGSLEIARTFAFNGYNTVCPDLHYREGRGNARENAISVREAGGMPDDRTMGDLEGAIKYLKTTGNFNGKVGVIGYCSGGRQTYLAACTVDGIDAAVDCYGGGVIAPEDQLSERQPVAPIDYTEKMNCPLLGLFGNEDKRPSVDDVNQTETLLKEFGKTYEFHRYDGANHGFFTTGSPMYNQAAAVDGWQRIYSWFGKYLKN